MTPRLQVNCDHVATVRQARRAALPDPVEWSLAAERAGAHGVTCHLRKDRRHVQDHDVARLRAALATRLNLELGLDPEIVGIALESAADEFCIVPETREEITTEGGLDVLGERARLAGAIPALRARGGLVSLFIDPDEDALAAAADLGAEYVELHTGAYANAVGEGRERELARLARAVERGRELGLRVNAGHGLDYANVGPVAALPGVEVLNIGHAIVARSLLVGVGEAVRGMLGAMAAGARRG